MLDILGNRKELLTVFLDGLLKEAGITPGMSQYDTSLEQGEALLKAHGQNIPRETLETAIKSQGLDPQARLGFNG